MHQQDLVLTIVPGDASVVSSREELAETGNWVTGLFDKPLQLSSRMRHLIQCS